MPLHIFSDLSEATGCTLALSYNTNILQQLDPVLTGSMLESASFFDLKEREGGSVFTVPTGFAISDASPLMTLRFRVLLSDTDRTPVKISQLSFGSESSTPTDCYALATNPALVTLAYDCSSGLIAEYLRQGTLGSLRISQQGSDLLVQLPEHSDAGVLQVFDQLGQPVTIGQHVAGLLTSVPIKLTSFADGMYFIRFTTTDRIFQVMFIRMSQNLYHK